MQHTFAPEIDQMQSMPSITTEMTTSPISMEVTEGAGNVMKMMQGGVVVSSILVVISFIIDAVNSARLSTHLRNLGSTGRDPSRKVRKQLELCNNLQVSAWVFVACPLIGIALAIAFDVEMNRLDKMLNREDK